MRFLSVLTAIGLSVTSVTTAQAQEVEGVWAQYQIDIDTPVVEGAYLIAVVENGQVIRRSYPMKKIAGFIAEDCASGRIGKIEMGEQKQSRRRGETRVIQYFTTSCQGGIRQAVRGTKHGTQAIVVKMADGRDEATYRFGRSGDILTVTENK